MILWDPAGHFCSGWVDNSLEDGSLSFRVGSNNFAQQEVEFCDKVHDLFEMTETLWTLGDLVKNWFFFFSWVLIFRLFYKMTCVSGVPTTQGGKQLRASQKISTILASWLSSLFKSWRAEFSWDFGSEWETAGIFKTLNPLIKRQK